LPARNTVPWHRVVNAQGKISLRSEGGAATVQAQRLKREGVRFSDSGVIAMSKHRWQA
jgi:methylated-DNA-protein-cysteine methyltransferase-like protein